MTLVSLADCCRLLFIDPKTLRRWLGHCGMAVQPHPTDARLKCVTPQQVQQLAAAHHRALPQAVGGQMLPETPVLSTPRSVTNAPVASDVSACITALTKQLASLQAHVSMLEHQLTRLPEPKQQGRISHAEVSLESAQDKSLPSSQEKSLKSSLDKSLHVSQDQSLKSALDKSLPSSQNKSLKSSLDKSLQISQDQSLPSSQGKSLKSSQEKSLESAQDKSLHVSQDQSLDKEPVIDQRKHPRVLPLVEYGVEGTYVLICPQRGRLEILPDSPEWFAWLSTLPSFRFVGQQGRFTAFRGYQCSPSTPWWAHRQIRNHSHRRRLGLTPDVSIASLETAAASLQALV